MRVTTWHGLRDVRLDTVAPPPDPGPTDVLLDVTACGICGSDVHSWAEGSWIAPGIPMGHEFAGMVAKTGAQVAGLKVGDRVAVNPMGPCHACDQCRRGTTNLCSDPSRSSGGGLGDQVLVRDAVAGERLFVLPDTITDEEGAFLEPLSVAVRAVRTARADRSAPVVVTGLGTIGQCVVQVLASEGGGPVIGVDVSRTRREIAAEGGADLVLDPRACDVEAELRERFGSTHSPYRPDQGAISALFECSGAAPSYDLATRAVRAGGVISLVAIVEHAPAIDVNAVVQKELLLRGAFAYTAEDCQRAFDLLRTGRVDVKRLVSHRFPLSEVAQAFEAQAQTDSSLKVMVMVAGDR